MKAVPLPPNETERLRLLRHLEVMDSEPEELFDAITRAIAYICDTPVALVSLVDETRQWFKSKAGLNAGKVPGEAAFCAQILSQDGVMVIPDASKDERFSDNPLVREGPKIRFYAGAPLKLSEKTRLGTLCVIDYKPRKLDKTQLELLELMADHVVALIRMRLDRVEVSREFSTLVLVKQKLQYQKDLMEAILDNEPESVLILSPSGEIEQVNKTGLDMLEIGTLAEARLKRLIEYIHPEHRDSFSKLENKVFRGEHAIAEYKICGAKGTERWMESHVAPLRDQQGRISELIAITRDVTEIKVSQQRLVLAARVFTEAQEGIIITDAQSVIVDVNPAFCNITGYCREEVIGQTPRILHSGLQGPDFYAAMWKTLGETGHWKGEIWNRKKNGELYAELISINALRDEAGNAINYVALFLDITDIKKQQGNIPNYVSN
jgi:PAS domain S-box-containing protein